MSEREVVLEAAEGGAESAEALRQAMERAEKAEAELARLKKGAAADGEVEAGHEVEARGDGSEGGGEEELRKDSMMAHLLDSLEAGKDIGHYGRLVFAMVARHFLPEDEVVGWLTRDKDFSEEQAEVMMRQVESRDYNPPKRERIVEWQAQQEFPILPNPEDPDCGNLYRNLKFPEAVYEHIGEYQVEKIKAGE
jgi:hypothetical protein